MMKKILIMLIAVLMIACANPVVEEPEEPEEPIVTNPFIGTWICSFTAPETGNREEMGFIFRNNGTFTYWHSYSGGTGSGTYTYTDYYLIFSNFQV